MPDLMDHRFLFVVGKGGVGKTTVSAALALAAARKGKRVLVTMPNVSERLSTLLGSEPIGDQIVEIEKNLHAVNMSPKAALEEYGLMILKVKSLYRAIFENRFVEAFLRGTPGIEAWAMLGKAYFHAVGHGPEGKGEYDLVLLDAPATGHGLDMMRTPKVILDVAPPGLLRREAERALALFQDRERAGALLVTLAEDMPVNESIELYNALGELGIHVPEVVVNQILPVLFEASEREAVAGLPAAVGEDSPIATLAQAGRLRTLRERTQAESLTRLDAELPVKRRQLPRLLDPEFERAAIESLSAAF